MNDTIFYTRLVTYLVVMAVFGYLGFGVLDLDRRVVIAILALQAGMVGVLIWLRFGRKG